MQSGTWKLSELVKIAPRIPLKTCDFFIWWRRRIWLCSLYHKMFPYCNVVVISSVSHCSCVIIYVPRPRMISGLPNIAIKMQHRSWILCVFWIFFLAFSSIPHFLAWQHAVLSREQLHLSGGVCINENYPLAKKGNLTWALLWAWSSSKCSLCPHAAGKMLQGTAWV